jgi:hypothetical protein
MVIQFIKKYVTLSSIPIVLGRSKTAQLLFMLLFKISMAPPTTEVIAPFVYFNLLKTDCELQGILWRLHSKILIN